MSDGKKATLIYNGEEFSIPVVVGTEGEEALDINGLRAKTGLVTLDNGYMNTAACKSAITYIDGEKGILRYRGYPVEYLAENHSFVEVAYLLLNGELPREDERRAFSSMLNENALIHEDMRHFFYNFPEHAHQMGILSAMVVSLSSFYPELDQRAPEEPANVVMTRLLSKLRTIAAFAHKKRVGEPFVYPRHDLSFCENFLNMMFSSPVHEYELRPELVRALNVLLTLHADHEQNCSTSAVRLVGSAKVNVCAAISAGICALWGPLHGGANQAVLEMLRAIRDQGGNVSDCVERAKNRDDSFRLYGFGHRVYKTYDPRAKIIKKVCDEVLATLEVSDPLLDLAMELEERALADDYFIERRLYPNVDFYSGIIYRAMGIPESMFTVMFALGRLPGWVAQWSEAISDPSFKIQRPRQIYTGMQCRIPKDKTQG